METELEFFPVDREASAKIWMVCVAYRWSSRYSLICRISCASLLFIVDRFNRSKTKPRLIEDEQLIRNG